MHSVLGLALAALVWLVGAGCLALLGRPLEGRSLLDAYPFGLLVTMAAAVPALVWRPLLVLSLLVVAVLVAVGVRRLPLVPRGVGYGLAGAAAFGVGLGALLHGPTDELDSAAYGGMLWYVVKVVSAAQSVVPFRDLLAEGETMIYAEAGTSFVGAVLSWVPGFDPILYQAATLPTFAAASLATGLVLVGVERRAVAYALIAVAVVPYATWLTETPPAAFALPLVFSLWRIWRDELDPRWLVALSGVVALDYFQTKVLGIMALGFLLLGTLVERNRARPDFARLVGVGVALLALGAAVVIALLFTFASWYAGLAEPKALPFDALRGLTDGDVDRQSAALALLVAGEVVLAALLVRARAWTLVVAFVATALLSWFVAGYGFDIALLSEIFLVALLGLTGGRVDPRLALAAGTLLALSVALRDPLGGTVGAALALALLVAVGSQAVAAPRRLVAGAAAAALALALVTGFDLADPPAAITTADRDIWTEVRDRVPGDALVFTTMTGVEVTPHRGWNNYPAVAERQLFLAGWYDGRLVSAPEDRDRKLAQNREVLAGRMAPTQLELSRDYDGFFAVADLRTALPRSFRRVYANGVYALYEIP